MHTLAHTVFQFDGHALDVTRGCLLKGGREVELRPKVFEVLRYLVENADRLVSKDDIIKAVWPGVFVTDDSLTQCVRELRVALGDSEQRIIKTVPRRGYLFAAPVSQTALEVGPSAPANTVNGTRAADSTGPEAAAAVPEPGRRIGIWRHWAASAGAALLLAAIVVGVWFWREPIGLPLPDRPSIAVLPFINMGTDPKQEYFCDGITEDLITRLSKFSELFVIARDSAFTYKSKRIETKQIGRELGVRYLLQGSVRRDGERLRITGQLVDTNTGKQIWAEYYDRETGEVFAIQDDVTQRIVRILVTRVTQSELERALRKPPETLTAYDYYLRGNAEMKRREGPNRGQIVAAARNLYEKSIVADPHYAPAIQGLAYTYITAYLEPTRYEPIAREYRQKTAIDLALSHAQKAVELEPHLPEARTTLGWILHWQYRRNEAIAEFERAFELNPNLADGRFTLVLYQSGRAPEAIEQMKRIMRLDPFPPAVYFSYLGNAYYLTGQYEKAIELIRASAKRLPGYRPSFVWLAAVAAQLGQDKDAREAAAEVLKIQPDFTISWFLKQIRLAKQEDADRLTEGLRKAGLPD
jgi:adenylate cyclase